MAERPEDLTLPASVVARIIKDAVNWRSVLSLCKSIIICCSSRRELTFQRRQELPLARLQVSSFYMQQLGEGLIQVTLALAWSWRKHCVCSANNYAIKSKRKTLSAADVFSALQDMELQDFVPELKECLDGRLVCSWNIYRWFLNSSIQTRTEGEEGGSCWSQEKNRASDSCSSAS